MTYPPPVYHGENGEISAVLRPSDQGPDLVYPGSGTRVHYLATGATTGGRFGLYRWEMGPGRSGPDPHFHRTMQESFYVLDGTVQIYDGTDWRACRSGDFVHVPEGGVHGFRNESGEPAAMLIHFSPGGPREPYFEGLASFAVNGRPSAEELAAFYRHHDNHFV
ncbi:cupin domain-containing protein [Actinomadura parmotrematis]|uniref:Cupin domain-containing protein n=1 Tax=Actinomadura parmotrematis TaxID=2864039 RepID=A0ABS7FWU7_9ACTN|nr:cupin domain-containing protein [Actinomadura parmotrematis]MBW8484645.1 cupin domain-containing protein [Actinomadura parmotrematis]